jgi:hypothetical protein
VTRCSSCVEHTCILRLEPRAGYVIPVHTNLPTKITCYCSSAVAHQFAGKRTLLCLTPGSFLVMHAGCGLLVACKVHSQSACFLWHKQSACFLWRKQLSLESTLTQLPRVGLILRPMLDIMFGTVHVRFGCLSIKHSSCHMLFPLKVCVFLLCRGPPMLTSCS